MYFVSEHLHCEPKPRPLNETWSNGADEGRNKSFIIPTRIRKETKVENVSNRRRHPGIDCARSRGTSGLGLGRRPSALPAITAQFHAQVTVLEQQLIPFPLSRPPGQHVFKDMHAQGSLGQVHQL